MEALHHYHSFVDQHLNVTAHVSHKFWATFYPVCFAPLPVLSYISSVSMHDFETNHKHTKLEIQNFFLYYVDCRLPQQSEHSFASLTKDSMKHHIVVHSILGPNQGCGMVVLQLTQPQHMGQDGMPIW